MKEVDDTPVTESKSELTLDVWFEVMDRVEARIEALEKELALLLEQRVTVRPPEATDDPEWF